MSIRHSSLAVAALVFAIAEARAERPELIWSARVNGAVYAVAFSPDDSLLATGAGLLRFPDLRLWDAQSGQVVGPLAGPSNPTYSLSFSTDGQYLAAGGVDAFAYLFRVSNREQILKLGGSAAEVRAVAISPDGRFLAASGVWYPGPAYLRLFSLPDGGYVRNFPGHGAGVMAVAFSPDSEVLASGSIDKTVKLWRISDGEFVRTLQGHTYPVRAVAYAPDGQTIASAGGDDKTVRLWRATDGELLRVLLGHSRTVHAVAFSPDGEIVATVAGEFEATIKLWRVADGELLKTFDEETGTGVLSVAFSHDGKLLAYGRLDGVVDVARNPYAPVGECGPDAILTAKCKGGGSKVTGSLKKATPDTPVTFTIDGERPVEATTSRKGKAKVKYTGQAPGAHTVRACELEAGC
ncbi:MAG: WD40 repeat domain-containing protein [Phycisphaerales bacterium]|nr:MAG: WD40 repeat domain-containing protein [Phycisphaerales bacterium]